MSSFEKPFRGLSAEIRLSIWEYVASSAIEVVEDWQSNLVRLALLAEDGPSEGDDEKALEGLEFHPPLSSFVAIMQASRLTHNEFAATIDKTGLSFDVTLVAGPSICELIRHFGQASAPRLELLRINIPVNLDRLKMNRLLLDMLHSLDDNRSAEKPYRPVPRFEIAVPGQAWKIKSDAVDIRAIPHSVKALPFDWYSNHGIMAPCKTAINLVGIEFMGPIALVSGNVFGEMAFDLTDLDERQKQIVEELEPIWRAEWLSPGPSWLGCDIIMGPAHIQDQAGGREQSEPSIYRYQIVFRRRPDSA